MDPDIVIKEEYPDEELIQPSSSKQQKLSIVPPEAEPQFETHFIKEEFTMTDDEGEDVKSETEYYDQQSYEAEMGSSHFEEQFVSRTSNNGVSDSEANESSTKYTQIQPRVKAAFALFAMSYILNKKRQLEIIN